ncbi:hypothetical protein ABPG75_009873 [Micractinium tetrahymenae]
MAPECKLLQLRRPTRTPLPGHCRPAELEQAGVESAAAVQHEPVEPAAPAAPACACHGCTTCDATRLDSADSVDAPQAAAELCAEAAAQALVCRRGRGSSARLLEADNSCRAYDGALPALLLEAAGTLATQADALVAMERPRRASPPAAPQRPRRVGGPGGHGGIIVVRSTIALAFSVAMLRDTPLLGRPPFLLLDLRGTLGTASMVAFYLSLVKLPLADSITLLFLNPAFCALLGRALLGERVDWLTGIGCLASLAGVVLVAQPPFVLHLLGLVPAGAHQEWSHDRLAGIVLGVAGAVLASLAYITICVIGQSAPSLTIAAWFHLVSLVGGAIPTALGVPLPAVLPSGRACLFLLAVGCASFASQLLVNRGFQLEKAARGSAFNFTQVICAHAFGVVFFCEPFSTLSAAGPGMIAAGVVAVSLDKLGRSKDAAPSHQAAPAAGLKAKSSFKLEPDDPAWAEEAGAEGQGAGTAPTVQLGPLDPSRLRQER